MTSPLDRLLAGNRLEQLDDNLFSGNSTWRATPRLFGGEVMSQSISAAQYTVADDFYMHSFHAYFMRPGDPARAVIYDVENIRDGRSFLSRRVTARQHGNAIYSCQCSFQGVEVGLEHQHGAELPAGPEGLMTDQELFANMPNKPRSLSEAPIEYRQVAPIWLMQKPVSTPSNAVWLRANGELPDALKIHQQLLAFASDTHLLATSLRPHGVHILDPGLRSATIDHSLWFHRPFRIDDWLLYELYSPWAGNGRGLNFGRIYDREGNLVASSAQEGMIRLAQNKPASKES
ncbi:acyl-CoA thioesterase II [Halioxenophilus sp. WMMB6]|uniref:acyl-CoA thioesterase n=1 Tax=Halioxenophilus sp. WMMB6 TaxID=3073815 RepID=UPI00295E7DF4|nr:acyl-CoA thioesterase II [Halioxenophilus sp. WMMB6]